MASLVILDHEKLRQLAKLIYYQEVAAIQNIQFKSELERGKYLADCKACLDSVLGLLDGGGELQHKFQKKSSDNSDDTRDSIAHDIFEHIRRAVNSSLQTVRNYTVRLNYLNKISVHSKTLITALEELDPNNVTNVARLAKDAALYKNAMLEYVNKYQSGLSTWFSKSLNEKGIKFDALVRQYQAKLNFNGPFKDLEDVQKLQVYEEIIGASGRGKVMVDFAIGATGAAVLLFTAGMMVWDIYSSDHKLETATRDAVTIAASVGGAVIGDIVAAALTTELAGIEGTALFVTAVGFATGFVGAFIIGAVAGLLLDLIFGSGGSAPLSTEGHIFFVAPMPDGALLARQIAHG